MKFSNPRMTAEFTDWPLGGDRRGTCVFVVESHPKKGQRIARTTTGKPKYTTYAQQARIVDGDDGRTYLLFWSTQYSSAVRVCSSDCQHDASFPDLPSYIPEGHERYKEIVALITSTITV